MVTGQYGTALCGIRNGFRVCLVSRSCADSCHHLVTRGTIMLHAVYNHCRSRAGAVAGCKRTRRQAHSCAILAIWSKSSRVVNTCPLLTELFTTTRQIVFPFHSSTNPVLMLKSTRCWVLMAAAKRRVRDPAYCTGTTLFERSTKTLIFEIFGVTATLARRALCAHGVGGGVRLTCRA